MHKDFPTQTSLHELDKEQNPSQYYWQKAGGYIRGFLVFLASFLF